MSYVFPPDQFALQGVIGTITVYANDCDPMAHELAMKMRIERTYENTKLVPIKSKFKDLYEAMLSEGVEDNSLSGIIIGKFILIFYVSCLFTLFFSTDTGISPLQWADKNRGFCHLRNGILDLRFDPNQNTPTGIY